MPTIAKRENRDGSTSFQAAVRIADKKPRYKSFDNRADAERFASQTEHELRREKEQQADFERQPATLRLMKESIATIVSDFADFSVTQGVFVGYHGLAPTVIRNVENARVRDLDRRWCKAYAARMRGQSTQCGRQYTWDTIVKQISMIRAAIKWRADHLDVEELPRLPSLSSIAPRNYENPRERRLERGELALLFRRLRWINRPSGRHWVALVRLALETGARLQELVFAEWGEFDLVRRCWTMPAEHTKSRKRRNVPLSRKAIAILKALRRHRSASSPRVLHLLGAPGTISSGFHMLCKSADIRDLRFHDLRHEAICRMVLNKRQLSVYEIMRIVGHSSMDMLNRYANLRGDELADRME